jgi:peroxiredoxin
MSRQRWVLVGAAFAALALGLALAARHVPATTVPGASASALFVASFPDLDGRPQALAQFKGRLLVVNFWATWCAPCVEEMPELQRIHAEYSGRGVAVIGIGIDNPAAMRKFRDEQRIEFALLAAGAGGSELARQLGNPSGALPFTVLVDTDGLLALRRLGPIRPGDLRTWLDLHSNKSKT